MQATSLPMESMGHKSKKEANFVKKYEVMFIVNAANDEVIKAAVKLVQDTITRIGGTVDKVDEWGNDLSDHDDSGGVYDGCLHDLHLRGKDRARAA